MFIYLRKAQYHETDQMGIIHHANYVKWMEEARVEFLSRIGMGYKEIEERGVQSPVTEISVQYKKSIRFEDVIKIHVFIKKYNGVRLELGYQFVNHFDGSVCTIANSKHCFITKQGIVSLKKEIPELDHMIRAYMKKEAEEE